MTPQPSRRDERSLDGTPFVHEVHSTLSPMQRRESLSAFSKEDTRRPPASSNRSNHPQHSQFDTNNANLTANINSPNNSKFPTPSGPANAPPFSIIQNNDPRVIYTGPWTLKGNKFVTTHSTTTRGASVHLKFNGTSIVVFGTVPASNDTVVPPTAVFVVDSNPPVETAAPTAEKPISNQPLFAADQLSGYYEHTINITIVKTDAPFTLESFFVTTDSSEASTTTSTGTATTTDTAISSADVSAHYTSPSSQKSARSSSGAHVGLKVAAAIIGTVLIIIIFSAVFFLIRRRREARRRSRDTAISFWTSTESILQANPSLCYTRSDGRSDFRSDGRVSYITQTASSPPPLPPKALLP